MSISRASHAPAPGGSRAGFEVHFDASKRTSGQRFFAALCRALERDVVPPEQRAAVVLFNVSAPIGAIVRAKLRRQKVVLRVDGLYFDRLSSGFLASFGWPLRQVFSLGVRYRRAHDLLAHLANFLNQNYASFVRILLADFLVYQSQYSRDVHRRYFPGKRHCVIVNGSCYVGEARPRSTGSAIRLVTIYDDWKPAKRVHDLVEFVRWAREQRGHDVVLTILGYTGNVPACVDSGIKTLIESAPYVRVLPKFKDFADEVRDALLDSDMYITFTDRDPCPNAVIEAMAHGLPVVGMASGGVPDIVADAGVLLPGDEEPTAIFGCSRYECAFAAIDFERVFEAVREVKADAASYRGRVRERFRKDLDINVVASRYAACMRSLLAQS